MSKFFAINPNTFIKALFDIGEKIERAGGHCKETTIGKEVVITFHPPKPHQTAVRIFTSIGYDTGLRNCGDDAIRVVVGVPLDGKNMIPYSSKRIFRTAPQGTTEEREKSFLERVTGHLRNAYKEAISIPYCPKCNRPMKKRTPKEGQKFNPFWGCSNYPNCKETKQIKKDSKPYNNKSRT